MFENLNENTGFGRMRTLLGPLSEKLNLKFVKTNFSGSQKRKNGILTLNFKILGQLGSLITSRHGFRWFGWNIQKLMQVRYTSDVRTFQVVKVFFPRENEYIGGNNSRGIRGFINLQKKQQTTGTLLSIFDVKYSFNKRTVT